MATRAQRRRAALQVCREERVEPTLETLARLRPNPLAVLSQDLQEAAQDLRDTWLLVTAPAQCQTSTPVELNRVASMPVDAGGIGARSSAPTPKRIPGAVKRVDENIWWWGSLVLYRGWYEEMVRRKLPSRPVVAIVAQDKLPEEVLIPQLGVRHPDQVMALLQRGLEIFLKHWKERVTDFS